MAFEYDEEIKGGFFERLGTFLGLNMEWSFINR